jgi:hypothetical protein
MAFRNRVESIHIMSSHGMLPVSSIYHEGVAFSMFDEHWVMEPRGKDSLL